MHILFKCLNENFSSLLTVPLSIANDLKKKKTPNTKLEKSSSELLVRVVQDNLKIL